MNLLRNIIIPYRNRIKKTAFQLYEYLLNVYATKSLRPSGYYKVQYPSPHIDNIIIYDSFEGFPGRRKIKGEFEVAVCRALANESIESDVFVVGGGFGYHTVAVSQVAKSVTVFEFDQKKIKKLREIFKKNNISNVDIVEGKVGDTIPLDDYPSPDVALIDIEGWELKALNTVSDSIQQTEYWIVEVHKPGTVGVDRGVNGEDIVKFFETKGFQVSKLSTRKPGNYHIEAIYSNDK
jgi:hypothetical protein